MAALSRRDWLGGRGDEVVLVHMIGDVASRVLACFYTGEAHLHMLGRWLGKYGRPKAYTLAQVIGRL
jgi:hypothetical protein